MDLHLSDWQPLPLGNRGSATDREIAMDPVYDEQKISYHILRVVIELLPISAHFWQLCIKCEKLSQKDSHVITDRDLEPFMSFGPLV